MGGKSLMAAPLWAARYQIKLARFNATHSISEKRQSCIIKVLVSISPISRVFKYIFRTNRISISEIDLASAELGG